MLPNHKQNKNMDFIFNDLLFSLQMNSDCPRPPGLVAEPWGRPSFRSRQ